MDARFIHTYFREVNLHKLIICIQTEKKCKNINTIYIKYFILF